jgi:hypothetical protein
LLVYWHSNPEVRTATRKHARFPANTNKTQATSRSKINKDNIKYNLSAEHETRTRLVEFKEMATMFCGCSKSRRSSPPKKSSWLRLTKIFVLATTNTFFRACYYFLAATVTTTTTTITAHALDPSLLDRAATVRKQVGGFPSHDNLYFPSAFLVNIDDDKKNNTNYMRGFCNWILPNRVMVGQYPGQNPELSGPSPEDVQAHLESVTKHAGVNLFCSLQSELPPQSDFEAWEAAGGEVYLEDDYWRRQFPNPFTHYAPIVQSLPSSSSSSRCQFWHAPIEDLSVPDSSALQELLTKLLHFLEDDQNCVYIHCWGGRGRAGLVGACLLSLLYPEVCVVDAKVILDLIQTGYDGRAGADRMPPALSKSPQTDSQRTFVRSFVKERRRAWTQNNKGDNLKKYQTQHNT